ncbi:30S ribosomal protein S16 [Candidatus Shapirobacteria bacterium CG10_big_fil_rev_8_21_14_0_10_40_9]|uniref:30S ribosomal protein S16 n=1 Tax=Candidatus Shapirobacteria bacterium CG10_big_fil_rev_8_21_14_0_10_40_9 TaxID=1974888 RepID=A0A2M8L2X3_9BACT|nr:MAG: 30S ribosomal protein S16 [Candidatus Shapirobacteria bacterium CG10_big_fil_rev_8_21_14_0_10_40_9]
MSLKIRLAKTKTARVFRIVVGETRSKRDGKAIDILGNATLSKTPQVKIDNQKYQKWLLKGAKPTKSVQKLLK